MATRKFLYLSGSGFAQEQSTTDDLGVAAFSASGASTLAALSATTGSFSDTLSLTKATGTGLAVTNNATIGGTFAVTGTSSHTGAATFTSTAGIADTLSLTKATGTGLAVTSNATIGGTLAVTGATTVGGTLGVTGASTLASASVTGAATVGSTLGVTGNITSAAALFSSLAAGTGLGITANATIGGTLGVSGATTLAAASATTLSTSGLATLSSATVTNALLASSTLTATGASQLNSTLGVTGAVTLSSTLSSGASTLASASITGAATVGTTLGVTGASTLASASVTGAATVGSTLGVTGNITSAAALFSSLAAGTGLGITANATIGGTLAVTGASTLSSTLAVAGASGLTGILTMGAAIAMSNNKITNLGDPTSAQDAATKAYVDGLKQGLDTKASVRAATAVALPANSLTSNTLEASANGALAAIDGITMAVSDRVLIKNESTGANNGIYTIVSLGAAGSKWSMLRAVDMDSSAECVSAYAFVEEGSTLADTGWVMSANETFTLNTTSVTWTQFSSAGQISAGDGIDKTGLVLSVNLATDPGLQFTTVSGVNKLDMKLLSTGGLQKGSTGASIKIASANQLASDASGLAVTGVPLSFKINGDAVSAAVTHTNLGLLTDAAHYQTAGGVNALHQHMSVPTAQSRHTATAAAIAVGDPICVADNNTVKKGAANVDASALVFGVAKAVKALDAADTNCEVVSHGYVSGALSGATAGAAVYLASAGGLSNTYPTASGNRVIRMGFALNASDLFVVISDLGKLAA